MNVDGEFVGKSLSWDFISSLKKKNSLNSLTKECSCEYTTGAEWKFK